MYIPLVWIGYGSVATRAISVIFVVRTLPLELPCKRGRLGAARDFAPFADDVVDSSSACSPFCWSIDCLRRAFSFAILLWISDVWASCRLVVVAFCWAVDTRWVLRDMRLNKSFCELTKVPCCSKSCISLAVFQSTSLALKVYALILYVCFMVKKNLQHNCFK